MNILFVIGSLSGGGAEHVVSRLANKMSSMGHNINIAMIANNQIEYKISDSVNVKFLDAKCNVRGLRMFFRMNMLRSYVKKNNIDVVVSFTAAVNVFALRALWGVKTKIIISERNNPYVDPASKKSRKIRDKIYKRAHGYVFQTQDAKEYFAKIIGNSGTIIGNPLDTDLPDIYTGERKKRIVTVGRLEPQKNQKMLIEAFASIASKISGYSLEIYGEGNLRGLLQEKIEQLGMQDRIFLKGHDKNVLENIKNASLFVLPSDYEGISNALIEAMAIGLPVISTDHPIGGAGMVINDGINGYLVPVGDTHLLAKKIYECLTVNSFNSNSKNAYEIRNRLNIDTIALEWLNYIETIAKSSK